MVGGAGKLRCTFNMAVSVLSISCFVTLLYDNVGK